MAETKQIEEVLSLLDCQSNSPLPHTAESAHDDLVQEPDVDDAEPDLSIFSSFLKFVEDNSSGGETAMALDDVAPVAPAPTQQTGHSWFLGWVTLSGYSLTQHIRTRTHRSSQHAPRPMELNDVLCCVLCVV
eukprot:4884630-Alexandrium_andersonii.AAC.1